MAEAHHPVHRGAQPVRPQGADGEGGGAAGPGAVLEGEAGRPGAGACTQGAAHSETGGGCRLAGDWSLLARGTPGEGHLQGGQ